MDVDVVIVGAGPAGTTTALNLAPFQRVLVVEPTAQPLPRVGESVPGAIRRLLGDMGLLTEFLSDGHLPRHALCSAWGNAVPIVRDSITDPDGHGWQIDRVRFEQRLRFEAERRGAAMATGSVRRVRKISDGWAVELSGDRDGEVTTRLLIDASGRRSRLLASEAGSRERDGKLCCTWLRAHNVALPSGIVQIEAEHDGWWYASPLPAGGGLLAFHTDADLSTGFSSDPSHLLERVRERPMIGPLVSDDAWSKAEVGHCAAHGTWLSQPAGEAWLAVGDAALAFDPLSSQGLLNALYLGLSAAEAADRWLRGDEAALNGYAAEVSTIRDHYLTARAAWYALETRWPNAPFWIRRREMPAL